MKTEPWECPDCGRQNQRRHKCYACETPQHDLSPETLDRLDRLEAGRDRLAGMRARLDQARAQRREDPDA